MNKSTCTVDGCAKPIKRYGYCYGHYMKNWRYGTPTPQHATRWEDIRGQRFGTLTVTARDGSRWACECDCGQEATRSAGDLNRGGDSSTCGDRRAHHRTGDSYSVAHSRTRTDRGSAKLYQCVNCGNGAQHWSYNHDDPDERTGPDYTGKYIVPYSLDPNHYSPRCVPCHKRFDLGRDALTPARG